jgi:thioredoxin reductase
VTDHPAEPPIERASVAIIGGGPAGLTAATELRRRGATRVVVVEREQDAGGIPRHCHHPGFGLRDLRRMMTGPEYARRRVQLALAAGAEVWTGAQATGWTGERTLELTSPAGRRRLQADAVVLASGCRERPRSARLVAGSRPQGVMTTGMLQQLVYLAGERPGARAVIVGAEHVSFSALLTLAHAGTRAVAMTTETPRHQTYAAFRAAAALRYRTPLRTRTAVSAIHGRTRVEAIEILHLDSGTRETVECDLVVFTGDWIPDHELAVLGGATLDAGTRGPSVDAALRTTLPGVFAIGNLLQGAETADTAALSGRDVAATVLAHLSGAPWPVTRVMVHCAPPLRWLAPNAVTAPATAPPRYGRYLLRGREELIAPLLAVSQDGRTIGRLRLPRVLPGRSARLPGDWTASVDPAAGEVQISVLAARRQRRPREARRRDPLREGRADGK